jgi:hypothetical protein
MAASLSSRESGIGPFGWPGWHRGVTFKILNGLLPGRRYGLDLWAPVSSGFRPDELVQGLPAAAAAVVGVDDAEDQGDHGIGEDADAFPAGG